MEESCSDCFSWAKHLEWQGRKGLNLFAYSWTSYSFVRGYVMARTGYDLPSVGYGDHGRNKSDHPLAKTLISLQTLQTLLSEDSRPL